MKIYLSSAVILLFGIVTNVLAEDCEVPGKAMHWIADYCLHLAETDDFQEQKVQACFASNQGYKTSDTCENRKKYKMKLCHHLVSKGYYDGTAEACFQDNEFIPATVRNGGL